MKIDIAIAFNDGKIPKNIGMSPQAKPSYYSQTISLIESIKLNWDKNIYDYEIYTFYSRPISEDKKKKLESYGCKTVFIESEIQPYINKENIYNYETDGDYTLILDSDMIVLKTPSLEFEKDIYARKAGTKVCPKTGINKNTKISYPISLDLLKSNLKDMGIEMDSSTYLETCYHFNGGCFLMKNSIKKDFYNIFMNNLHVLRRLENQHRILSVQLYYSMIITMFNWGFINKKINVYSHEFLKDKNYDSSMPIEIVHYLGNAGFTNGIKNLLKDIHKKYEESF